MNRRQHLFNQIVLLAFFCRMVFDYFIPVRRGLKERVEVLGEKYLKQHPKAALVIAFYRRGNGYGRGFGKISVENPDPPSTRTIFEIGSVTKVFTGLVLAKMVSDGMVKLADPIGCHLPDGVKSPSKEGREITLENLATHTSGLPRMPDNFWPTVKDHLNPFGNYTAKDLYEGLATVKLRSRPGHKFSYSNYGYGLLGRILEIKSGKSYETLIQEAVCDPLGLPNTTTQLSAEQKQQLTPGHDSNGQVVPNWEGGVLTGSGRIRSNCEDLLKFIEANLRDSDSETSKILQTAQQIHLRGLIRNLGLVWWIDKSPPGGPVIHWHSGGTGGYTSFVGFNKKSQIGVVVLSNYSAVLNGDSATDRIGLELLLTAGKLIFE